MEDIQKIILISCVLAIGISVADMLCPGKKYEKQMKLIFSLIFLTGLVTPIISGDVHFSTIVSLSLHESSEYSNIENSVYEIYCSNIKRNIENNLINVLSIKQIKLKEIDVNINIKSDKSIFINEVTIIPENIEDKVAIEDTVRNEVGQETSIIIRGDEIDG